MSDNIVNDIKQIWDNAEVETEQSISENVCQILDSGNRREFNSGAVRDIDENKGRMDLLPLDTVSVYFNTLIDSNNPKSDKAFTVCNILNSLEKAIRNKDDYRSAITQAITSFVGEQYEGNPATALMELSIHYKEGAKKYAERNWEKGIPCHCYVDSALRHLMKWYDGWDDEPHDKAVLWNLFGLMWTIEHRPEMNDLPWEADK